MTLVSTSRVALVAAMTLGLSAFAAAAQQTIIVEDAYARAAPPSAPNGAAFMMIRNPLDVPVHLTGVSSDLAARTELHTHIAGDDGVMKMVHVEEGFTIPANGMLHLKRGAEHVMFMGFNEPLKQGETITITFHAEGMDDIPVDIVVDHEREPAEGGMMMDHGTMNQGAAGTMDGM